MSRRRKIGVLTAMALMLLAAAIMCIVCISRPSKVTRENFVHLTHGMTEAEVAEVFGERGEFWSVDGSDSGRYRRRCWVGNGTAYLVFDKKGRLSGGEWHEPGFSSQTKDACNRVRFGMVRPAVNDVFGRPPDKAVQIWKEEATEVWRDIDGVAVVQYVQGQVSESSWQQRYGFGDPKVEAERDHRLHGFIWRLFDPPDADR